MKIFMCFYLMMIIYMPLFIMFIFTNFLFMKNFMNPVKQIIFLIMYTMTLSMYIYMNNDYLIFSLMIMIIYLSGLMVLFSYFISLMNLPVKFKWSLIMFLIMMWLMIMFLYMKVINLFKIFNYKIMNKNFLMLFNLYKENNNIMFFILLIMLIFMLMFSYKMCMNKFMSLRQMNEK